MNLALRRLIMPLALAMGCIVIFGLAYRAPRQGASDSLWTLLVSQSIIQHQTIRLDAYKELFERNDPNREFDQDYRIQESNGHYYSFYPIGTSVFSVPFVWAANLLGQDMSIFDHEVATQGFISAVLCMLAFVIFYELCRCYLSWIPSLVIALITVLGTSVISTMGAGLWSHNFTVVFTALSLLLIARYESGRSKTINPYLLGFLLFAAYLCRPTAVIFMVLVLGYIALRHRAIFLRLALTTATLFLAFTAWSWLEYGRVLPVYYTQTNRLGLTSTFWQGVYGNLLSPSRGILVFSPFFLVVGVGVVLYFRQLKAQPLFWLCAIWFGLQIALISSWDMWWGGYSYGPRLLTDVVPALVLITTLVWQEFSQRSNLPARRLASALYLSLGLVGILIHSYHGLYNVYANLWNLYPDVDEYPGYLYDWRYPQFLATGRSMLAKLQAHLEGYAWGEQITYASDKALFVEWRDPAEHEERRWSQGTSPQIILELDEIDADTDYALEVRVWSPTEQGVDVTLNDAVIGRLQLPAQATGSQPEAQTLVFDASLLQESGLNRLGFVLSDPSTGLAFVSLEIHPVYE